MQQKSKINFHLKAELTKITQKSEVCNEVKMKLNTDPLFITEECFLKRKIKVETQSDVLENHSSVTELLTITPEFLKIGKCC